MRWEMTILEVVIVDIVRYMIFSADRHGVDENNCSAWDCTTCCLLLPDIVVAVHCTCHCFGAGHSVSTVVGTSVC